VRGVRLALVGLIFFALAGLARADTWVADDPADPDALAKVSAPDGTAATSTGSGHTKRWTRTLRLR
jgi:hypothetical protein